MIARIVNSITCCRYSNSISQWPIIARIGRLLHRATERSCCRSSKGHLSTGVAVSWTHHQLPNSGETQKYLFKIWILNDSERLLWCYDPAENILFQALLGCYILLLGQQFASPNLLFSNRTWYQSSRRHRHSKYTSVHNPPFPSSFHNPLTLDRCDHKIRPYPLGSQCGRPLVW